MGIDSHLVDRSRWIAVPNLVMLDVLMQRPAQRHIQQLHSAANAKNGKTARNGFHQ
jgi:hypothetical protein